mmetsp:Transcript_30896/g.66355  ORF Transcript_30896/g.66355 Transcript_30896/m.66355 type:complete len:103 (-) Transcript_30896:132-440(-)
MLCFTDAAKAKSAAQAGDDFAEMLEAVSSSSRDPVGDESPPSAAAAASSDVVAEEGAVSPEQLVALAARGIDAAAVARVLASGPGKAGRKRLAVARARAEWQ